MKPLIALIGRSGSGKNYIASKLERKGFTSVKSYTTRPVRQDDPNDINTHTFISPDRVSEYKDDIVADTYFNGAYYFATRQQLNEADIYIYLTRLDLFSFTAITTTGIFLRSILSAIAQFALRECQGVEIKMKL